MRGQAIISAVRRRVRATSLSAKYDRPDLHHPLGFLGLAALAAVMLLPPVQLSFPLGVSASRAETDHSVPLINNQLAAVSPERNNYSRVVAMNNSPPPETTSVFSSGVM